MVAAARLKYGDDPLFEAFLNETACPCLLPVGAELIDATLPEGWVKLTQRERQVASLLAEGKSDKEIATELSWRLNTARSYSSKVLATLAVHSRRQVRWPMGNAANAGHFTLHLQLAEHPPAHDHWRGG